MKKTFLGLIFVSSFLVIVTPLYAETNFGRGIKNTIRETIQEGKEASLSPKEIRQEVKEQVREEIKERNEGLLDKVKNMVRKNLRFNARIKGTIGSVGASSMTVTGDDGKTYAVNITSETKLLRRFGGTSGLSEFSVGNEVSVIGKFTDESQTTIDAKLIRNLSIQKRWGVFFGEVTVKNSDNFVMKTIERGDQTVYFGSETKFLSHKKETISYTDLQIGNRVRVKGMWDRSSNKITEIEEIRVFPQKPSVTPTP